MDIERVIAQRLKAQASILSYLAVPSNPPDEFLVVEMTGASGTAGMKTYSLDIDVWGKDETSRKRTHELAKNIIAILPNLEDEENIFAPRFRNLYRNNDIDTGRSRYTVQIECSVCE